MITERDIAEKFSVIWRQNFPLLNQNFMRRLNIQVVQVNPIPVAANANVRYDLVSEVAFNLTKMSFENNRLLDDILSSQESVDLSIEYTARTIWKVNEYSESDLILNLDEISEVTSISRNTIEFINYLNASEYQFNPKLKGYGVFPDLIADISIDDTLFEIKTVNRNFRSSDIKQLLIYLALQQATGKMKWKYGGLYNPRKGVYYKFNIQHLIYNLSGGNSSIEAFENLLNSLTRDIQLDSRF